MRKIGFWVILLMLTVVSFSLRAQRTITGVVVSLEDASPLEGVQVSVKGSRNLSGTQADGIYYINVSSADSVLVFRYDGYSTKEVPIGKSNEYNVSLQKESAALLFPAGNWRGVFTTPGGKDIPFNFEIDEATGKAWFLNAEEKFEAGKVAQHGDSLYISIDPFDSELAFKSSGTLLNGVFRRLDGKGSPVPVRAEWGAKDRFRFTATSAPAAIAGTYDIYFKENDGTVSHTVALINQNGSAISAVILRTTGDSRYLEGVVNGQEAYLSSFIGSSPSLYHLVFDQQRSLTGEQLSLRGAQSFTGVPNSNAKLPDPYSLTLLKPSFDKLSFSFPTVDGRLVSLDDAKYRNKVVIVTITGTWCPNCIDEAAFLSGWFRNNQQKGVEAIAIHYERQTDSAFLNKVIPRFRQRHGITYEEVIGGVADKKEVARTLPALQSFLAFPTIIFIDKKGKVARIYTGFSGPATGKFHQEFIKEFQQEIDKLLSQS